MRKTKILLGILALFDLPSSVQQFKLNTSGYFQNQGVDVMAFDDIYPDGHQGSLGIILHGNRVATGDRLEAIPGQWQPVPVQRERKLEQIVHLHGLTMNHITYGQTKKRRPLFMHLGKCGQNVSGIFQPKS